MYNENNIVLDEQRRNNTNDNRDFIKFTFSAILNILIVTALISYSIKYRIKDNIIQNINNKTPKENLNVRILDQDNFINRIERHIFYNSKNNNIVENEVKKYLEALLENLGGFDSFRDIITGKINYIPKEAYFLQKQKQILLSRLVKNIYSGTWEYFPYTQEEYEHNKNHISNITKFYYLNSSQNIFKIGNYKNGTVNFSFKKAIEMITKKEALALTMKNLEGNYIDNWIQHISYDKVEDLNMTIDDQNKLYIIKGEFITNMVKGKLFANRRRNKINNRKIVCGSFIELEFPLVNITLQTTLNDNTVILKNISTIDPRNFTMIISSSCGFRIKIKGEIFDITKDSKITKKKINIFSYLCIIGSLLYLVGATSLTCSLNRNENAISVVSLDCYCQNLAWHSYCGITNINFGLIYSEYFGNFCMIALFSLVNFVVFDLRFLYFYWKIKRRVLNDRRFLRLRLRFFAIFYGLLILSFLSVSSFYMNWIYISILSIALWTPQIIHNIIDNNKYMYPTFYILSTTIDRMIYPLYFRGYGNNFFQLKNDLYLMAALLSLILISIIILYLQAIIGPRFMLPQKYQKNNTIFYKSREELLEESPDCIKEECVICLSPLIEGNSNNDSKNSNLNVIINNKENENENSVDSPTELKAETTSRTLNGNIEINNNNKNILKKELHIFKNNKDSLAIGVKNKQNHNHEDYNFSFKNIIKLMAMIFYKNMFKFYKFKTNKGNKNYMIIACGHIFHATCIEKWFDRKKECPSCRASMEEYL